MNKFCIKPTLVLAASLLFLSCGEQKPEAKTSLQQMSELNDAQIVLLGHIAFADQITLFESINEASEINARHNILLCDTDLWKDGFKQMKKILTVSPEAVYMDSESVASASNFNDVIKSMLNISAKNIRSAKPTDDALKEAYDKLGDAHSKFEAMYDFVADPSGNVLQFNRRMSDFSAEINIFSSWWKREIASQIE